MSTVVRRWAAVNKPCDERAIVPILLPMSGEQGKSESPELAAFRERVRDWIEKNKPAAPNFVLPQSFLEVQTQQELDYLQAWQHALYAAGYLGFDVPVEYGGQGVDPGRQRVVHQELGRSSAPFLVNQIALQWVVPTLLAHGTEAQKKRLIAPILSAEEIWCQGFSEPEAGSDLASLQTRAVRAPNPEDGYLVTGTKVWTTVAHFSKWMILLARTDPQANKYAGISYFLFPMGAPGVTIEPLVKMTGEGGFNQVTFDEAPMPLEALLGNEGEGWKIAMTTLMFERGAAESSSRERASYDARTLERVVDLAKRMRRDGHSSADDPVLRDELAQLWIEVEAMRIGARRAAIAGLNEAHPQALAMTHKLTFTEFNQRVTRVACKLLGPEGLLWMQDPNAPDEAEWPRAFLNSYGFTIGGGTSEIQRNIAGERVLGLPKSK